MAEELDQRAERSAHPSAAEGGPLSMLARSKAERVEAQLDAELAAARPVTRPNEIAVLSPKGGVGKTSCAFVLGNLLAARSRLRVIAVDANREFGTLGALAPDALRSRRTSADLLADRAQIGSAATLLRYVSSLPTGLHLLAAPREASALAELTVQRYRELLDLLRVYYDVIVLDVGAGITDPLIELAVARADQTLVVTNPGFVSHEAMLAAVGHLRDEPACTGSTRIVVNRSTDPADDVATLAHTLAERDTTRRAAPIPDDPQLATMLDAGIYSLDALAPTTRIACKRLGAEVAGELV